MVTETTPAKRIPFLLEGDELVILEGYTLCEECGGDGGGDYPARWSFARDEPDYDWAECSVCSGAGQVMTIEMALHLKRKKLEAISAPLWDLDEDIPF